MDGHHKERAADEQEQLLAESLLHKYPEPEQLEQENLEPFDTDSLYYTDY